MIIKKMAPNVMTLSSTSGDSVNSLQHSSIQHLSLTAIPEDYELTENQDDEDNIAFEDDIDDTHIIMRDPAPNGGYGWVIVFLSFFCNLIVDGIAYTFGLFFDEFVSYFGTTKTKVALVGSLLNAFYLGAGPLVGALVNYYGCRIVSVTGSCIAFIAFILSIFAPNIEVLMLTYGVLGGIGFGMIYLPAIVSVGYYFTSKRAFATGIAVCGSGVGAFLFAPLCQFLLNNFDWKNSLLILAGLILNCVVFGSLIRPLSIQAETYITEPDSRKPYAKPLMQRIAEEKRRRLLSHSVSSQFLLLMQGGESKDGGETKRLIINTEPGVHSTLNLDQLFNPQPQTLPQPQLSPIPERKNPNSEDATNENSSEEALEETIVISQQELKDEKDKLDVESELQLQDSAISLSGECVYPSVSTIPQTPVQEGPGGGRSNEYQFGPRASRRSHRTISESSNAQLQGSQLQIILSSTPSKRSSIKSSQTSIFVRPMYKKDIFYGGSNLQVPHSSTQQMAESQVVDGVSMMTSVVSIPARDILDRVNQKLAQKEMDEKMEEKRTISDCCLKLYSIVTKLGKKREAIDNEDDGEEKDNQLCQFMLPAPVKDILNEMLDFSLLRSNKSFLLLTIANVFGMMGFYVPFVYLTQYAVNCVNDDDENLSPKRAAYLISVIGITNTFGRLLLGWLSDKITSIKVLGKQLNALTINNVCILLCGITIMGIPFCTTYISILINCVFFGLFVSAYVCLTSIILVDLLGLEKLTNAYGILSLFRGFSSLIGPPLAGAIYDLTGSYHVMFIVAGLLLIVSSLMSFFIPSQNQLQQFNNIEDYKNEIDDDCNV